MAHRFINEIEAGAKVSDIYMVKEPILRSTTRGDLYIAMYLCDRTGQLNGRMWQASEAVYNALPQPGFVHVDGRSELYQNNMQLVINNISVVDADKVNLEDFMARTEKDTGKLFDEVKQIVGKIKNRQLKALVDEFLGDGELMERFCNSPAAMKMHHNYLGGLLEHTHNMLRVAKAILPLYPDMQEDLVLAGIFIHDMGKTEELSYDMAFSYTDSGQLIGHIVQTLLMMNRKAEALAATGTAINTPTFAVLGPIILSKYGQNDCSSPKLPSNSSSYMVT